ncbi:unnamed protein product [Cuscuta europaea]|uniref:Uncharacterized protein n=1 Tax=Cuscuta europaea TaxID=41803 RepID=A0A9P1DYJ7_CUSEU|nr:unnamed protein product [Cuscuta europaea]
MASRAAYKMKEFLEVISLQEQLNFHELKRQRQPSASQAGGGGAQAASSLSEAFEAFDIQQRMAALQKKVGERQSPSVFEMFGGELFHTEPNPPSTGYASSTPVTFHGGSEEASTAAAAAYGGGEPFGNEGRRWTRTA